MATRTKTLQYKGIPLVRKDNVIYYGNMSDSHIIMMNILESKNENGLQIASKICVQLQKTCKTVPKKESTIKVIEKPSLWSAIDIAFIWLKRANSSK